MIGNFVAYLLSAALLAYVAWLAIFAITNWPWT
jgi:hypothetical protein